jgi:plasmid replication initiation protein
MRKFFSSIFKKIASKLDNIEPPVAIIEEHKEAIPEEIIEVEKSPPQSKKVSKNKIPKQKIEIIPYPVDPIDSLRDIIDLMEFPFLALSKDRIKPISYENADKTQKVVISGHRGHFIASIYDWDIILVISGKIQKILNNGFDIPPRKMTIPRHELLKALHKHDGKKQQKDLEKSFDRLKLTGISTTVNNKDFRHRAGFGFIDSWGYMERKDDREMRTIHITLSEWLYELCCAKGSLLKSNILYFDMTSGLKKFLYRTARKHAGKNENGWTFTVETLYEKSGSEGSFRLFKSKIKKVVFENDIPDYFMEWIEREGKSSVFFKRSIHHEIDRLVDKIEKKEEKTFLLNELK